MRRLSIAQRMILLVAAPLAALAAVVAILVTQQFENLKSQRLNELRRQVDTAIHAYTASKDAENPFALVRGLRYSGAEYFFGAPRNHDAVSPEGCVDRRGCGADQGSQRLPVVRGVRPSDRRKG